MSKFSDIGGGVSFSSDEDDLSPFPERVVEKDCSGDFSGNRRWRVSYTIPENSGRMGVVPYVVVSVDNYKGSGGYYLINQRGEEVCPSNAGANDFLARVGGEIVGTLFAAPRLESEFRNQVVDLDSEESSDDDVAANAGAGYGAYGRNNAGNILPPPASQTPAPYRSRVSKFTDVT